MGIATTPWKVLTTGRKLWFMALLVLMGAAWGLQFSMIKLATQNGYDEITVLISALVLISLFYVIFLACRRSLFRLNRERLVFLTITGLLGYVLPLLAAVYASLHVPAGIMTLLVSLTPVVTVATAIVCRTERVSLSRIAAITFGLVAVVIILMPEFEVPDSQVAWWMVVMLVVPLTYGVESVYVSAYWPEGLDVLQLGTGETILSAIMVLPLFLIWGDVSAINLDWISDPGAGELGIAVFALSGVLDILLYFYIIRKTGGVFVSFGMFISLFSGMAWGYAIFGEQHGTTVWIAVALLVTALWLVVREGDTAQAVAAENPIE